MSEPATRGRPTARVLLAAIILAITLGPRIRLPGLLDRAVDLRLQDLLLIPAIVYVFFVDRLPSMRRTWGPWPAVFAFGAAIVTVINMLLAPDMSALRTVAYLGRTLETFILAVAVAGLYRLCGDRAQRTALGSLHVAIAANVLWVAFQYATGKQSTLIGSGVGDLIEAYGPKLIGEGSAFGTGFFFALVAALGAAQLLSHTGRRWTGPLLLAVGLIGAYVSQSRAGLGAAAACVVLAVVLPDVRRRSRLLSAAALAVAAAVAIPQLPQTGRLSESGFQAGFGVRTTPIWDPLLHVLGQHPLVGIGTGQLGTPTYPWTEAHDAALRAALDYGLIVGALFLIAYLATGWHAFRALYATSERPDVRIWAALALMLVVGVAIAGVAQDALIAVMSTHLVMLGAGLFGGARLGPVPDRSTSMDRRTRAARHSIAA